MALGFSLGLLPPAAAQSVKVLQLKHDPHGFPRPAPGQTHVSLATSFYIELGVVGDGATEDTIDSDSVQVWLRPAGGERVTLLREGARFESDCLGRLFPRKNMHGQRSLAVFIDTSFSLQPETRYRIEVSARSKKGVPLGFFDRMWSFSTEAAPARHAIAFELDLTAPPVEWEGGFFTGFCKSSFCTSHENRLPTYELMAGVRRRSPRAWSLQRDFWMTGMQHRPRFLPPNLPNIVRERETRRITRIDKHGDDVALRVEDFFGHEQYGIPSARPLKPDYHAGDEVLIADGLGDARTTVLRVEEEPPTVVVEPFSTPEGGWRLDYEGALPTREDPNAPGLFPPGGCYLRKFRPAGTPHYFWGRLDKECDLAVRRFKRRLVPNFADAPGDLSIDGRNWTRPKDYAQYHDVVRAITSHFIERYGASCLDFPWSVFNEPDLGNLFWRSSWTDVQRFYDYTVDAVLRAFEDHGYDSSRVVVGGLELAAIFGTNLRLREFLEHCSPRVAGKKALRLNAAFTDDRIDGKRSRRVEELCRAHDGMGSPCDFVSIHSYNNARLMAEKLIRAKEIALDVDAEFFAGLRINSFESCPEWSLPPDPAALDSYLGNGYFPTWCADVTRRLLEKAADDARYARGETILTFWPWPNSNFEGANASTRVLHVDDDGDGKPDRTVTVAMPILEFLGLTAGMGARYWPLGQRAVGGHVVSGFASRQEGTLSILLYSHNPLDTESRSGQSFDVNFAIRGWSGKSATVTEYRFDSTHNSYFRLGRRLREETLNAEHALAPADARELADATALLESKDREKRIRGLRRLATLGPRAKSAARLIHPLAQSEGDEELKREAIGASLSLYAPRAYPASVVREVQERSKLTANRYVIDDPADLRLTARLDANSACFLVVQETER